MKDSWYGNQRDREEWGVFVEIACRFAAVRA
jgi:hypothetical protein